MWGAIRRARCGFPLPDATPAVAPGANRFAFEEWRAVADVLFVVRQKNSISVRASRLHSNVFTEFNLLPFFRHGEKRSKCRLSRKASLIPQRNERIHARSSPRRQVACQQDDRTERDCTQ